MVWPVIAAGALGLGSALLGSRASRSAANTAANATQQAAETQRQSNLESLAFLREGRDMARADVADYARAGLMDYDALRGQIGSEFTASPGYEFARSEGLRAIDQGAAARGMLGSGQRLQELTRFGTGLANQEYGNWLSRLQALASVGQTASGQTASLAAGAGGQGANLLQQGGNNMAGMTALAGQQQAAGTVGATNALLGGAQQGLGLYQMLSQPQWGNVAQKPMVDPNAMGGVTAPGMQFP